MAKRKRVDTDEQEEPVSKPAASTDSETSDSDDEVQLSPFMVYFCITWDYGQKYLTLQGLKYTTVATPDLHARKLVGVTVV